MQSCLQEKLGNIIQKDEQFLKTAIDMRKIFLLPWSNSLLSLETNIVEQGMEEEEEEHNDGECK